MNKTVKYLILILTVIVSVILFGACSDNNSQVRYTVAYVAGDGGCICGDSEQIIERGANSTAVTATAFDGYVFAYWSDGVDAPERRDLNIVDNIHVTAVFKRVFLIEYLSDDGGRIAGDASQFVIEGEDCTAVEAVASDGYEFVRWSDDVFDAKRHDVKISRGFRIMARFIKNSLSVIYSAEKGGRVTGECAQVVANGHDASEVVAVPDCGYKFKHWSDTADTNPIRKDCNVVKDIEARAVFEFVLSDGSGTQEKPMIVDSYADLLAIKNYPSLYYRLDCDLDLSGSDFTPLFSRDHQFGGAFDGNGHVVRNICIASNVCPSFFGVIGANAIVKDLCLDNVDISINHSFDNRGTVGALAAISFGQIQNVKVSGTVSAENITDGNAVIGGMVGVAENRLINCSAELYMYANGINSDASNVVGGLAGIAKSDILFCTARGQIKVANGRNVNIGGLVGFYCDNGETISEIAGNKSDINITVENGKSVNCGGLIADLSFGGVQNTVHGCNVTGDIIGGNMVGGFIYSLKTRASAVVCLQSNSVDNNIGATIAGGFIYSLYGTEISKIIVADCKAKVKADGAMASGFCYGVSGNVYIFRCSSNVDIKAIAISSAFIAQNEGGSIKECFAEGVLTVEFQGSGFVFQCSNGSIIDCFSTCFVTVTNLDADSEFRTFACGFIDFARNALIKNCYSTGKISGNVYTESQVSGLGSVVGDFAGQINSTQIINCAVLVYEDTFATDVIAYCGSACIVTDLYEYKSKAEMSLFMNNLNDDIWQLGNDGLPML